MSEQPVQPTLHIPNAAKVGGLALLLFALTFALFSPTLRHGIMELDDRVYILDNPFIVEGVSAASLRSVFHSTQLGMYIPLMSLSYGLDNVLLGATADNPWGFHFTNIFLHSVNAALFFLLLFTLCRQYPRAFLFAALWAFHPLRVEAVAWLSSRKDVLSGWFALICLLAYLHAGTHTSTHGRRHIRIALYILSLSAFALGLLSKSSIVPIPFVLLVLDVWPLGRWAGPGRPILRTAWRLFAEKIPFFLLAAVFSFATARGHQGHYALIDMPLPMRMLSVPIHYAFYLAKTVFPVGLSPLYRNIAPSWLLFGMSFVLLGLLTAASWGSRRRHPERLAGWLLFLGLLFPVIGFVRFGSQSIADRFTYLPAIGLSIALVSIWPSAPGGRTPLCVIRILVAALFLAVLAAVTWRVLPTWKSPSSLFTRILKIDPNHPRGLELRASYLIRTTGDFAGALQDLQQILGTGTFTHLVPEYTALCLAEVEGPSAAKEFLQQFPAPPHPPLLRVLHWNTARYALMLNQYDDAIRHASLALSYTSGDPEASGYLHLLLMVAAFEKGDHLLALTHARRFPFFVNRSSLELADLLPYYLHQWIEFHRTDAHTFFRRLIPAYPERIGLLNNIAWGLATANWSPADPTDVLVLAQQVNTALQHANPGSLDTLAAAQANAGHFLPAIETIQQALDLLPKSDEPHVARFRDLLLARQILYRQTKPYRENAFARWMTAEFGSGRRMTEGEMIP